MSAAVGKAPIDPENDEERPLFEGRAALAVFPWVSLQRTDLPMN